MLIAFILENIYFSVPLSKSFISDLISDHPGLLFGVIIVFLIIVGIGSLFSKKKTEPVVEVEEKWINDAGLELFEKLKLMYNNNESLSLESIPELSDLPVKNMATVNAKFEVKEGKTSLRLWACIEWLNNRFRAENEPIKEISESEALEQYAINLNDSEVLHAVFEETSWYELKRSRTRSFNYHGLGLRIPLGAGLSYRVGTIGSLNPDSLDEYREVTTGKLFVTSKRLIFQGDLENKSININSILDIEQYRDSVIIGKTTGKKPLIRFDLDDAAIFSRTISRVF